MQPNKLNYLFFSRSRDHCAAKWCTNLNCSLGLVVRVWGWVSPNQVLTHVARAAAKRFGKSSAFKGWVGVRVLPLGYGFGVRSRKVKSRDCALASD